MQFSPLIRAISMLLLALQISVAHSDEFIGTTLKVDERIVFFTTDASLSEDGKNWSVPIHAWVHELENASLRRATVATVLKKKYGLHKTSETQSNFDRRIRLIFADNERDKKLEVIIAGQSVSLTPTQPNGHSITNIVLNAALVETNAADNQLSFTAALPEGDNRTFTGSVNLVARYGVSIISDFDDTTKITNVTSRKRMLDQSLYQSFTAVPGMARLYQAWASEGAAFHYVSSSPWQLFEPIKEFMRANEFPNSSASLKYFRFKDSSLLNLLKSGIETKPLQIKAIIDAYPHREFVLVGDSGEQDPEVYAEIYRQHPKKIKAIFIRNITSAKRTDSRFSEVFKGINPRRWQLFDTPTFRALSY